MLFKKNMHQYLLISNRLFFLVVMVVLLFLQEISAQVITSDAAYISIGSVTMLSVDTVNVGSSSTVANEGSIYLRTLNNTGIVQGSGLYALTGDFNNSGTFIGNAGTVSFNGNILQSIGGTSSINFYNLTLNNASGLILNNNVGVTDALTLSSGKLALNNRKLTIAGNFNNNGGAGTISGGVNSSTTSDLEISGTGTSFNSLSFTPGYNAIRNCSIGRSVSLDLSASKGMDIYNKIGFITSGNIFTTNDNLCIKSTAVNTGSVVDITKNMDDGISSILGNSFSGNITVERYIGTSKRAWRLLTIPVVGPTIRQAWAGTNANGNAPSGETTGVGTLITGHGATYSNASSAIASGFDFWPGLGGSTASSIRYYNNASWASATNTPDVKSAPTQQGYMLYVRGDRTVTSGEGTTTLRATGSLKTGAQTIAINQPYSVVGNPFASAINIKNMYNHGANNSAITNNFWVWDVSLGTSGAYRLIAAASNGSYIATPSGVVDSFLVINSGQAFFVQRNGSNATSIVIDENDKDTADHAAHLLRPIIPGEESSLAINLYQANANSLGKLCDGVLARFSDNYNALPTEPYDIYKLNNFNENLSLVRNNRYLGIESRPYPVSSDTLFLPFWGQAIREYALQINNNQFLDSGLTARLIDKFTKTETPLSISNAATNYSFSVTSDTASSSLGRFMIVLHSAPVLAVAFNSISASKKETKVQLIWNTTNETSVASYDIEKSADGMLFVKVDTALALPGLTNASHQWLDDQPFKGANYYRVRSNDKNKQHHLSEVALVQMDNASKIQVAPTVITNRRFTVVLNQSTAGTYTLLLTNVLGQPVLQKIVSHSGGDSSTAIDLGRSNIAAGVYLLSVKDGIGIKEVFRLLITQ